MSTISTAVGLERRARVSGYKIKKGFFSNETPNLPQLIAVFGEANTANQAGLTTTKREVTSANEAAELYGYGSPIHAQMRILRPISGDGVGGIPTVVFPQLSNGGETATELEWTVTGTATKNATHTVVVAGRETLDFQNYSYNVIVGDTPTIIAQKIADAVNGVLSSPVIATPVLGVVTFVTKWRGLTSSQLDVRFNLGANLTGVSYSQTDVILGTGTPDLSASLIQFGDDWYTSVSNSYGEAHLGTFEAFNGFPDDDLPTGRYSGLIFKPFAAFFGSTLSDKDDLVLITDNASRVNQLTNVLCPAPNSLGFGYEAAANMITLFSRIAQDSPQLDVNNKFYSDMPIPLDGNAGDMSDYNNRDFLIKKGCSTVILENGAYRVQDLVTTYHPEGETPLQYNYCRNLNLDWNVSDSYRTLETIRLKDKVLVADTQVVGVTGAIKPKEWRAVVFDLFDDLAEKALINEPQYSKDSLVVQISSTNPNRFETFFRYKRTGIARIESTDVEAGF
jgi:phage tail sheath gpL-like